MPGDYDGDGKTDVAVYRDAGQSATQALWFINGLSMEERVCCSGADWKTDRAEDYDGMARRMLRCTEMGLAHSGALTAE